MEAMEADGLDLDIVEQMKELTVQENLDLKEPDVKQVSSLFEVGSSSTKVGLE